MKKVWLGDDARAIALSVYRLVGLFRDYRFDHARLGVVGRTAVSRPPAIDFGSGASTHAFDTFRSQLFRNRWYELLVLRMQRRPTPIERAQYFGGFAIELAPVVVLMPAVEGGEPSRKPNCISRVKRLKRRT